MLRILVAGDALEPVRGDRFELLPGPAASEPQLRERLRSEKPEALIYRGAVKARPVARYATLDLGGRPITASFFASVIGEARSVRAVILYEIDDPSAEIIASALLAAGTRAVISLPRQAGAATALSNICQLLSSNPTPEEVKEGAASSNSFRVLADSLHEPIFPVAPSLVSPAPEPAHGSTRHAHTGSALAAIPSTPPWQAEIDRKREAGVYDVFLCHNWDDKPAVKKIARQLAERGVLPWLDEWELAPGQPWQPALEQHIGSIKSAAVFVGGAGMGPWQQQELYAFLSEFVRRRIPVIPVLLGTAPSQPSLPLFLQAMTWVDFRVADPDPFERLVWGITGKRPKI